MRPFARNFVIIAATTAIAIWLSTVKSLLALVLVPVVLAIGAQITIGTIGRKFVCWATSFLVLTTWLVVKEAYSPIAPPGVLALLGFWSLISAFTFVASAGIGYAFTRRHSC